MKTCIVPRFTAFSSASANTMFAPLPPNSNVTRFTVSEAALEISAPARVEPVNDIISMSLCDDICEPTPTPSPFIML